MQRTPLPGFMMFCLALALSACGGGSGTDDEGPGEQPFDPGSVAGIAVVFEEVRDDPRRFVAEVRALDADGGLVAVPGARFEADGGTAGAPVESQAGAWRAEITANALDMYVEVGAAVLDENLDDILRSRRGAIVLAEVADRWGQPEIVPGMRNIGWQDSAEISPDGEWLLVGIESPMDLLSCQLAGNDPDAPLCEFMAGAPRAILIGEDGAPEPDLFGSDRIAIGPPPGRLFDNEIPSLCLVSPDGTPPDVARPPTGAFGFRRRVDGSFGEEFAIGYDMDGFDEAPFGFSFVRGVDNQAARVVYAWADIREVDSKGFTPNIYVAPLTMGEINVLGRFSCGPDGPLLDDHIAERLELLPLDVHRGNPYLESNEARVWYDDGSTSVARIFSATREGGDWSEAVVVAAPVNEDGLGSAQPFLDGDRLFWTRESASIRSALRLGEAPEVESSWGEARDELVLTPPEGPIEDAPVGRIISIGEPSVATDVDGDTWLYFVIVRRRPAILEANITSVEEGFSADVARVRAR